jgi:hypothetical protein
MPLSSRYDIVIDVCLQTLNKRIKSFTHKCYYSPVESESFKSVLSKVPTPLFQFFFVGKLKDLKSLS